MDISMIKVLKNDPVFKQPFIGLAKSKKRGTSESDEGEM